MPPACKPAYRCPFSNLKKSLGVSIRFKDPPTCSLHIHPNDTPCWTASCAPGRREFCMLAMSRKQRNNIEGNTGKLLLTVCGSATSESGGPCWAGSCAPGRRGPWHAWRGPRAGRRRRRERRRPSAQGRALGAPATPRPGAWGRAPRQVSASGRTAAAAPQSSRRRPPRRTQSHGPPHPRAAPPPASPAFQNLSKFSQSHADVPKGIR